jgi:phosphate transport system substrate-binding protein
LNQEHRDKKPDGNPDKNSEQGSEQSPEQNPGRLLPLRSGLWPAAASVFGRGFAITITYVLLEIILIIFIVAGGSADWLVDRREWSDFSLLLLLLLYCAGTALLFGALGYAVARQLPKASLLVYTAAVMPVPLIGFAIWRAIQSSVRGAASDFGGVTWLPYQVYVLWSQPVLDSLQPYFSDGTQMKYAALLASCWPALAIFAGICMYKLIAAWQRKRVLKYGTMLFSGLWLLLFALSLLWPKSYMFTAADYPKLDGATAAVPFGKLLARELTGTNRPWVEKHVGFNTTHAAYENLIARRADLIFVSGPSDEELQLARDNGVKLKLTPIGKDAFIFLVHKDNGVNDLSVQQIQDIYTGKIRDWSGVGGQNGKIVAFQREKNSGSQTFMEQKVMQGLQLADPPMEKKSSGMGGLIDAVADYKNGVPSIGYSFYYFANEMHRRENVKFIAVDGIESNKENIRSGKYLFTALLYAVTREDEPADSPAGKLLGWLQGKEGSLLIERGGFVPVNAGENGK